MRYEDFYRQEQLRVIRPNLKNEQIAKRVLLELSKKDLPYPIIEEFSESLLYNYFYLKGTEYEMEFNELLNLYNFNYSMSIHNAIYFLLATENEHVDCIDPLKWPGVHEIHMVDSKYVLKTIMGKIEVYKASEQFQSTNSKYIFDKKLMGKCYERTYDFVKENRDYQVLLSYMPNFFYGGSYHAYLEKDNQVLDIASNALYSSKESISKIFRGEEIARLSYPQIEKKFSYIKKRIPRIKDKQKLLILTLYYDKKNMKT